MEAREQCPKCKSMMERTSALAHGFIMNPKAQVFECPNCKYLLIKMVEHGNP